ncbi:ABC transporter permease [Mechercharimyces sp. CAU 1602]|nr:ABC transporter permease [Mechercharimyces sp. CAU 1602]MCS1350020.1 ABC transporter permease [Mechercharimyces sp. CAU 1602]
MTGLVYNEMLKMVRKKRMMVIILILALVIPIFTYAQYHAIQSAVEQLGTSDWRTMLQQQIADDQNRLSSSRLPEEWRAWIEMRIQQQQYYLDHDINPTAPGAPTFVRGFIEEGVALFLPLLMVVVASDLVSSEYAGGTIKLLLTRSIRRWQVLASKYIALVLTVSMILAVTLLFSYLVSGLIFGYSGWTMPVLTGFQEVNGEILFEQVHVVPQWQYIIMAFGLGWFACIAVATISFMVSVLMRSTAAGMGVMMAALVTGGLLAQLAPTWSVVKYIPFTNLQLIDYLSGEPLLIDGMSLPFSITVLALTAIISLIVAFTVFIRRDVLA